MMEVAEMAAVEMAGAEMVVVGVVVEVNEIIR
jgi:hypothetical protein